MNLIREIALTVPDPRDLYALDELLTDAERDVRDRVRAFVETRVRPGVAERWERAEASLPLMRDLGTLGVIGGNAVGPGCPGLSTVGAGLVSREISRVDGSLATFVAVQTGLVIATLARHGDATQQQRWLPGLACCDLIGAFALTEPESGSDAGSMQTVARQDGDAWVLSGRKRWIGNATHADLAIVWARDDEAHVGAFVIERGAAGMSASAITGKASMRAVVQADVTLDAVRVPLEHRLPGVTSFRDTVGILVGGRVGIAWAALGHAQACYDAALVYTTARRQFEKPLASFQLVQAKLVDMASEIAQMQLLAWRAARLADEGRLTAGAASLAKANNARKARRVALDARDLLGGNGILLANDVARHAADLEAVFTFEGTDHINTLIAGREITGFSAFA